MPVVYPVCFLLLQYAVLALPPSISRPAAYIVMVVAPLLAALAAIVRGRREASAGRAGWYALAAALAIWALGAFGNLWQEWILGRANNHFVAGDPAFGPEESSIITIAFALLAALALSRPAAASTRRPHPRLVHTVRTASPILLPGALLIVSLFMIRVDYPVGTAGILLAVLGYGARTISTQVRHIERGEVLQRERSELQTIAWTAALTGVANRHFLDQALGEAARGGQRIAQPLSVLMIDIDHFKLLNDRYGHPTGDACLRDVAQAHAGSPRRSAGALRRRGVHRAPARRRHSGRSGGGRAAACGVEAPAHRERRQPLRRGDGQRRRGERPAARQRRRGHAGRGSGQGAL
jgi:hypothetical protein